MSIENVLEALIFYLENNRQRGHTEIIKRNADNIGNALIVVNHYTQSFNYEAEDDRLVITYNALEADGLRGIGGRPLLIDNAALGQILSESLKKIRGASDNKIMRVIVK